MADNSGAGHQSGSLQRPPTGWWEGYFWVPGLVGVVLLLFAATMAVVTLQLRGGIRHQLTSRDAEVLQAVIWMQHQNGATAGQPPPLPLSEPAEQTTVLLRASRLKGVVAARLFDSEGQFVVSFPATVTDAQLSATDLNALRQLKHVSRYYAEARVASLFVTPEEPAADVVPLLEVLAPIYEPDQARLLGIAQFYLDAGGLREKFAVLDRQLLVQTLLVFLAGGAIIILGLGGALQRLQRQHIALRELTMRLARANQELTLAAKSSAVGAVAAHLIHGLKSPLYGLHNLLLSGALGDSKSQEPAWQAAVNTTRELQTMINETARLLKQDSADAGGPETRLSALLPLVSQRLREALAHKRITLATQLEADARLGGREAALISLVLENLLRNAVQATPEGSRVRLTVLPNRDQVVCAVRDQGPGIPAARQAQLFLPCTSTKPGGLGIGLAISKQLANHLGAQLELTESTAAGCVFSLTLPFPPLPATTEKPHLPLAQSASIV